MAPFRKRPSTPVAIAYLMTQLHKAKALPHEDRSLTGSIRLAAHITQRTARIFGTMVMRMLLKHPLGWPMSQEVLVMLLFGIFQSRKISVWRAFFAAVGDLSACVPIAPQLVTTGSCSSYWLRLPESERPRNPRARINWLFAHGGAFVSGNALMYTGTFYWYLRKLAALGVDCSVLTVEYPLAPEHPFPCALHAVAGAIEWLIKESGEDKEYLVGGDSAGGNLAVTATALLRDSGRLTRLPVALTLISPATDISDSSVFASKDRVSSHIEHEEPAAAAAAAACCGSGSGGGSSSSSQSGAAATAEVLPAGSTSNGPASGLKQRLPQQPQQQQPQQQHAPHPHTDHHSHRADSVPGGTASVRELLQLLAADAAAGWEVQRSRGAAAAAAGCGWFDYLPQSSMVEEFHHYLSDPSQLTDPMVSPTFLPSFTGLSKAGMFITAGGAELMRPDIAAFAAKVEAAGVPVTYVEEPNEPHCWCMLALPPLLKKAQVLIDYIERVACEEVCLSNAWRVASDD